MTEISATITQYTDQSLSAIHHALRASRRRLVIIILINRMHSSTATATGSNVSTPLSTEPDRVFSVRQLAREIVATEEEVTLNHATGEPYHNVYTALIQTHLPQLDDVGAVEYDGDRKTVAPDANLVALAMVTVTTSPITKMLFHRSATETQTVENQSLEDSTTD